MTGELLTELRDTAREVIESEGFEAALTVTDKSSNTATVNGIATMHHTSIDAQTGLPVSGRQAHAIITIAALVEAGLSVFTDTLKPDLPVLRGFKVSFVDAFGKSQSFVVTDARPSATLGAVTCALGDKV